MRDDSLPVKLARRASRGNFSRPGSHKSHFLIFCLLLVPGSGSGFRRGRPISYAGNTDAPTLDQSMSATDHHAFQEDRATRWRRIARHVSAHPEGLDIALENIARWLALGRVHPAPLPDWKKKIEAAQGLARRLQIGAPPPAQAPSPNSTSPSKPRTLWSRWRNKMIA
jgi:hypothetical protein